MKILKIFYVLFVLTAAPTAFQRSISAQDVGLIKGAEQAIYKRDGDEKNQCYVYEKYVVTTVLNDNPQQGGGSLEAGNDIDIFLRDATKSPQENCRTLNSPLTKIKNIEGNEFGGIFRDLVFVRKNVYPDGGDFEIYNLTANKSVFSTNYSEWDGYRINLSGGRFLLYRQWSKKDGLLKNCREGRKWKRQGLGVGWLQTKQLDLQTMKTINIGTLRCIAVQ